MSQDKDKPLAKKEDEPVPFNVIDRRLFAEPDSLKLDAVEELKPRYPTFVEELMNRVAETERRFEEKKKEMQEEIARTRTRLQSDFERRVLMERQNLIGTFFEILDNLDRALAAAGSDNSEGLRDGVKMTAGLFRQKLESLGVEALRVLNEPFDPNVCEAVGTIPVADRAQDGLVLEEILPGYRVGDRVVRPARVRVGQFAGQEP